jgi:hypothetical protein
VTVLVFQVATAVLAVAFAVLALRVTRAVRGGDQPLHHRAWMVTALAFAIAGASSVVQNAAAVWAFRAGAGSAPWNLFLEWAPRGNYARICLKISFALLLTLLTRTERMPARRVAWTAAAIFAVMLVVGGVMGAMEGPLREVIHYPAYAVLELGEMIALLVALFVGLVAGSMDRWLWAALAVYSFRQALNVLSWTALAWHGVPGAWALDARVLHLFGIAGYLVMIAIAIHRLRLARKGVRVPGMFDLPRAPVSTFH